jgi:mRNA interferase YafQ
MLDVVRENQFKRDYKREKSGQHSDLDDDLKNVIMLLAGKKPLPKANKDHQLKGKWRGYRDCHVRPDLVLIYRRTKTALELARIGSHSELF